MHTDIFNQRLLAANNLLQEQSRFHKHTILEVKRIYQQLDAHYLRRCISKQLGTLQTCAPDPRHSLCYLLVCYEDGLLALSLIESYTARS